MKEKGCYFDEARHGWVRFGNFFPFEAFGNGPFFHDSVGPNGTLDCVVETYIERDGRISKRYVRSKTEQNGAHTNLLLPPRNVIT